VDVGGGPFDVEPGRPTAAGARAAIESVILAASTCRSAGADAVVTAPVSKAAIAGAGYEFCGHTEFLADLLGATDVLMLFVHGRLRVAVATTHVPLARVAGALSRDLVATKLAVLARGLEGDLGVASPSIAVTGLNPHAGEDGRVGDEERSIIVPAIADARSAGIDVDGPFPADSIFLGLGDPGAGGPGSRFDAVLAMYHDQGTIPVKLLGFGGGVNVTLGLPVVRTSVDHGTAFDLAGREGVNAGSMLDAVRLAGEIARRRLESACAGSGAPIE